MTLDVIKPPSGRRRTISATEAALPSVLEQLTDVLLNSGAFHPDACNGKTASKSANNTPKRRRSRCVWTEDAEKPRVAKAGSRRHQRFMNVKFLMDLGFPEDDLDWSYATPSKSHFQEVIENPKLAKKWSEFANSPEEKQNEILGAARGMGVRRRSMDDMKTICREIDTSKATPEKCFNRLDRRLRTLYRKSHVPSGAVEAMERDMLDMFTDDPENVVIWKLDNSFFRGILHGICQYHNLHSCSESFDGVRRTVISNPHKSFTPSSVPLFEFIRTFSSERIGSQRWSEED